MDTIKNILVGVFSLAILGVIAYTIEWIVGITPEFVVIICGILFILFVAWVLGKLLRENKL